MNEDVNRWISFRKKQKNPKHRLICISFAGGGASYYINWQKVIGSDIEIVPIQLPGRENRMHEKCFTDCKLVATEICKNIVNTFNDNVKLSIFGHSMGGIIAFEVARQLEKIYNVNLEHCFISSTTIQTCNFEPKSIDLSDDDFFERVKLFGGINDDSEILKYPEFKEIFLKILRADFSIVESYKFNPDDKIAAPLTIYYSSLDKMVNQEAVSKWECYTKSSFDIIKYDGTHFYLNNLYPNVCDNIKQHLFK